MTAIPEGLAAALADRYRLERELGAGGMATVYLAEDLKHHRQVAIKVLRPDLAASLGAERFLREVGIAARLSHPHILGLFDSGETAGFLYYVMPYVEGISLRQKLQREGELPIPEAVRILRDIADALAHAHRQGVVHRDIKPENVMLVERNALVMDFGVAKALAEGKEEGSSSLTSAGVALGTPAYMAPEQASGEGHVDHRADLYAWGVVAYELLAGQPPFIRSTPQAILAAQATATPEPVTAHRENLPGALATLVMQCLEKKAADRPQTAEEVLRQLDQVLTPSGGMTPTDTRPYQTAGMRRAKRRQLMTGAAVVAGLAIITVLGWRWWQAHGVPIVADRVVIAPFRNETGKAELADLGWRIAEQTGGMVNREGITDPVPLATVRERLQGEAAPTPGDLERLARQTGAGLVVRGNIHARGDSVEVRTEILRMPAGTRLYDLAPVVGASADARVLDRVAQQVALALQLTKDWGDDHRWGQDFRMPASLAAYREGAKAVKLGWQDRDETRAAIERALALDSTWPQARLWWIGTFPKLEQDSLVTLEQRATASYLPGDLDLLQAEAARLEGDREGVYQALKRRYLRDPAEYKWPFIDAAYTARHWRDAARAGAARGLPDFYFRRTGDHGEHIYLSYAFHALGWHDSVLQYAREIRKEGGERLVWAITGEIITHAALHHVGVVDSLVAEAALLRAPDSETSMAYMRDLRAAEELRAHGEPDAARRTCSRYADKLIAEAGGTGLPAPGRARFELWAALSCGGRNTEALAYWREFLVDHSTYWRAWLAVQKGDRALAYAIADSLAAKPTPKNPGSGPAEDALRILCWLGDTTRAIVQFQRVWRTGDTKLWEDFRWHVDKDYELIRNHPAVLTLMRPKD